MKHLQYFLTVERCNDGRRGIFCDKEGNPFRKDGEPHTEEEMFGILGPFDIILSPRSQAFTEEQISAYTVFRPLAEYKKEYGIAFEPEVIYYGIICPHCGPVKLTLADYRSQLVRPNDKWYCTLCGRIAEWDDERHDASHEQYETERRDLDT